MREDGAFPQRGWPRNAGGVKAKSGRRSRRKEVRFNLAFKKGNSLERWEWNQEGSRTDWEFNSSDKNTMMHVGRTRNNGKGRRARGELYQIVPRRRILWFAPIIFL